MKVSKASCSASGVGEGREEGDEGAWEPIGTPMARQNSPPLCTMASSGVQISEWGEQGCSPLADSNNAERQAENHSSHDS